MRKNAALAIALMLGLCLVIELSDGPSDTAIQMANDANLQDALTQAQLVAIAERRGTP